jgi:phospholysine phosphohistidine inorganic pyrophosphate phosphatase
MTPEGLLLDLDGTLYVGDAPLPGAIEAMSTLDRLGIPRRFLTNTTRMPRRQLAANLHAMGFAIDASDIFTAAIAADRWLAAEGIRRVALFVPEASHEDFTSIEAVDHRPEAIVVGDLGTAWSFERLNEAFRHLLDGARLVALQRNRYWRTAQGFALDAGAFVAALEYAADVEATVVGKPSPEFFRIAVDALGLEPHALVVVGDDVETDVAGAHRAGLRAALVRTGKYRPEALERVDTRPEWIADSLGHLVRDWYG